MPLQIELQLPRTHQQAEAKIQQTLQTAQTDNPRCTQRPPLT
jgi:hypothetical protein